MAQGEYLVEINMLFDVSPLINARDFFLFSRKSDPDEKIKIAPAAFTPLAPLWELRKPVGWRGRLFWNGIIDLDKKTNGESTGVVVVHIATMPTIPKQRCA